MSAYLRNEGVDVNQTRTAFSEAQQLNQRYAELATDAGFAAGGALPPPWGTAVDVADIGRSVWGGQWGSALFGVIGLVPIVGDAAKGARIANRLNDVRRAVDAAGAGLARQFGRVKTAASKYWDDIARRNRQAYEDAIRNCADRACRERAARLRGPQYNNTPTSGPNGQWVGERGDSVWQPAGGGPPITYRNGFPDYSPHSAGNVEIPVTGDTRTDFRLADQAQRQRLGDPNWERPNTHTWHHVEDGTTMQLIPKDVHATGGGASTPHMGGASMYGSGGNASGF